MNATIQYCPMNIFVIPKFIAQFIRMNGFNSVLICEVVLQLPYGGIRMESYVQILFVFVYATFI